MDLIKCTIEIIKIAENHVEKRYILYTIESEKVIVHTEIYGQQRIDDEILAVATEKTKLLSLNINDEIAKQDIKLVALTDIQIEMDKEK